MTKAAATIKVIKYILLLYIIRHLLNRGLDEWNGGVSAEGKKSQPGIEPFCPPPRALSNPPHEMSVQLHFPDAYII